MTYIFEKKYGNDIIQGLIPGKKRKQNTKLMTSKRDLVSVSRPTNVTADWC